LPGLRPDPDRNQQVESLWSIILSAIDRGSAVTKRLLAFARRDQLRAAEIDTKALLTDLQELLNHTLGGAVSVQLDLVEGLPKLFADRMQLETVLINLATNARDAMSGGGIIKIVAGRETVSEQGNESVGLPMGRMIRLSVCDSGIGMDAKTIARAVEPYFATKGPGKGTGLGLSMAKGFAEQSGGGFTIASRPGEGTVVTIWLPEVHEYALTAEASPKGQPALASPATG
jgi:signal transduction histidine kinase